MSLRLMTDPERHGWQRVSIVDEATGERLTVGWRSERVAPWAMLHAGLKARGRGDARRWLAVQEARAVQTKS